MDNTIGRLDGFILIFFLIVFLIYGIITAKEKDVSVTKATPSKLMLVKNILFIIIGIVTLSFGANFVVQEAITIANKIGLSQTFIGISVVALGTSLPELATSAVAAARGESDISVGNVVGSNLFNICLVMGTVGIFNPMAVDKGLHYFQFPFMIFICLTLGFFAYLKQGVSKTTGSLFIVLFVIYISVSYFN